MRACMCARRCYRFCITAKHVTRNPRHGQVWAHGSVALNTLTLLCGRCHRLLQNSLAVPSRAGSPLNVHCPAGPEQPSPTACLCHVSAQGPQATRVVEQGSGVFPSARCPHVSSAWRCGGISFLFQVACCPTVRTDHTPVPPVCPWTPGLFARFGDPRPPQSDSRMGKKMGRHGVALRPWGQEGQDPRPSS